MTAPRSLRRRIDGMIAKVDLSELIGALDRSEAPPYGPHINFGE
jgi:hypothetical protein